MYARSSTRAASQGLPRALRAGDLPPVWLCPRAHRGVVLLSQPRYSTRRLHTHAAAPEVAHGATRPPRPLQQPPQRLPTLSSPEQVPSSPKSLPLQCSGCGAFSQSTQPSQAGFFDLRRKATQRYLGDAAVEAPRERPGDRLVWEALQRLDLTRPEHAQLAALAALVPQAPEAKEQPDPETPPLCGRCHDLVHHSRGSSIYHPSIDSIRETLEESPHKRNHIYHVIDAADFPMSLVPRIHELVEAMPLRSRNRRSRREKYYQDRLTELSFVVARSDLLAPTKPGVDRLMPWITSTLRDALGSAGRAVRLGNVHCVSAKRSWWTSELKEAMWRRGGATWMVGKANVGKSYLLGHIFPGGRMDWADRQRAAEPASPPPPPGEALGLLLPPPCPETNYPHMPVVSALPGTTASPIRLPFGRGKGELIDLPGLPRSALSDYVEAQHHDSLVMESRIQPKQAVLKGHWHSLLLGGFIRLTPRTPDLTFLAYNFTPLQEHRTNTDKAVGIQEQTSDARVDNIAVPGTGQTTRLAGSFELKYDVTKQRTGPITRRDGAGISVDRLPYRVVAIDILIEGCGWVEVVAQVRTRDLFRPRSTDAEQQRRKAADLDRGIGRRDSLDLSTPETAAMAHDTDASTDHGEGGRSEPNWPIIDVYSPEGKFIAARQPMNGWQLCHRRRAKARGRPRPSMKGAKKRAKVAARVVRATEP